MSGEASYTVTNLSSRSFIFGDIILLPKVPATVTETQRASIDASPYAEFFEYELTEPDPPVRRNRE